MWWRENDVTKVLLLFNRKMTTESFDKLENSSPNLAIVSSTSSSLIEVFLKKKKNKAKFFQKIQLIVLREFSSLVLSFQIFD